MRPTRRLVIYGSMGLRRGISDLLWAFRKAHSLEEFPAYLDDHPFQVMERIRAEKKNRMKTADVVLMPHYAVDALDGEGLLERHKPRDQRLIPPNMRGTGTAAVPVGATFMAMAYNPRLLSDSQLPENLDDLSRPKWKGALGAQSLTSSRSGNLGAWYFSYLRRSSGEQTWLKLLKSLSGVNRPRTYDCIDHLLQGLHEGEAKLALTVYSLAYFREKSSGNSVALLDEDRVPHMMTFTSAGVVSGAEDRAAGRFVDFLLSTTGQEIIGSIPGIAPLKKDVSPGYDFEHRLGTSTDFHPTGQDAESLRRSLDLFRTLGVP